MWYVSVIYKDGREENTMVPTKDEATRFKKSIDSTGNVEFSKIIGPIR